MQGDIVVRVPDDVHNLATFVLLEQEDWFEDEIEFVRRLLSPGELVVDVGANYGVYALTAAAKVGPQGRVVAFEPAALTVAHLQRSAKENGFTNLNIVPAALSDHTGQGHLSAGRDPALASVVQGGAGEPIQLLSLDDANAQFDLQSAGFVKLDAEGHEPAIVAGGEGFFRSASPLVMFELSSHERSNHTLARQFSDWGYGLFRLVPGLQQLLPIAVDEKVDDFTINVFAAKPDRKASLFARGLIADPQAMPMPPSDWRQRLMTAPASAPYANFWQSPTAGTGADVYEAALAHWVAAHANQTAADRRYVTLAKAAAYAQTAYEAHPSGPRCMLLARIAAELGVRVAAVEALKQAAKLALQGPFDVAEPFVLPAADLEQTDPQGRPHDLVLAAVLQQLERLRAHSSQFVGAESLPLLDRILATGFATPQSHRRRQLLRWKAGLQTGPEPEAVLAATTPQNKNAAFWLKR